MRIAWLAWTLFYFPHAFAAAPTITGVTGASNSTLTGTATIFGGLAGVACSNGDTSQTCSSCTADGTANGTMCTTSPLCQCNEARIYNNLVVRINLQAAAAASGTTPAAGEAYGISAGTSTTSTKTSVAKNTATNGGQFIDFTWSTICGLMGNTDCESLYGTSSTSTTTYQVEVDVCIDTNGSNVCSGDETLPIYFRVVLPPSESVYGNQVSDGIGAFTPFPGDGKVYLTGLQSASAFPNLSYGVPAQSVRVFASTNGMDDANYANVSVTPKTLALNSTDGTLANNEMDSLSNNQLYFFRIAVVDQANNVVQYFPDSTGLDASCTAAGPPTSDCPYSATPSQVLGLLTKDVNCFVATAAYGSALEPKLETFRKFRRRFLLTNAIGRRFVAWYYRSGPFAARFIADRPLARAAARLALWPAYLFGGLALRHGIVPAAMLAILGLLGLGGAAWRLATGPRPR